MKRLVGSGRRLAVAAAAALAATGVAYATIPDAGRVYTACAGNGAGNLRLIDPSLPSTNPMSHCTTKRRRSPGTKRARRAIPAFRARTARTA